MTEGKPFSTDTAFFKKMDLKWCLYECDSSAWRRGSIDTQGLFDILGVPAQSTETRHHAGVRSPLLNPVSRKEIMFKFCFCSWKGSIWTLKSMLEWDAWRGAGVHHIISPISHREPRAITVDVISTAMLDPVFLKDEYFKISEGIMGYIEHRKAIMVLITFQ